MMVLIQQVACRPLYEFDMTHINNQSNVLVAHPCFKSNVIKCWVLNITLRGNLLNVNKSCVPIITCGFHSAFNLVLHVMYRIEIKSLDDLEIN